jgi:hypothetical protein
MELDEFAKGAVGSLLTDLVRAKTGLAYKVAVVIAALAFVGALIADGWLRWIAVLLLLVGLAFLVFVFVTKRIAMALINRMAPPADLANVRQHFDAAIEQADIPTGPVGFLRLMWRLRQGVGPEIERLGAVVARLQGQLDEPSEGRADG